MSEFFPVRTEYAIDFSKEDILSITVRDIDSGKPLHEMLEELDGVSDVEYGYNQYVYLSLDNDSDTDEFKNSILEMINTYIEGF